MWMNKKIHLSCSQGHPHHHFHFFFWIKYIMQWTTGHINKIFSSPEKVKLIFIYFLVQFQQLLIFKMPFYDLAKFILKFWLPSSSWQTPMTTQGMEFQLEFSGRWTWLHFGLQSTSLDVGKAMFSLNILHMKKDFSGFVWQPMTLHALEKELERRDRRSQVTIKALPLLEATDVLILISANDNWKWNPTSRGWD